MLLSFEIARGLFGHNVSDFHAILGVPIGSDAKVIRKRYLQIAPRLHPDTCPADLPDAKEQAKQLMSRLVNPAYATLSNDGKRAEHEVVLRMFHSRLSEQKDKVALTSPAAQQLATAADPKAAYAKALQDLAARQYESLEAVIDRIAEASELNLAYLLRASQTSPTARPAPPPPPPRATPAAGQSAAPAAAPSPATSQPTGGQSKSQFVDRALARAEELLAKGQTAMASQELKEALKLDGNNAGCHALLGKLYLQQKQTTLAKVHLTRALAIDPQHPIATAAKRELDRLTGGAAAAPPSGKPQPKTGGSKPDKPGGGLLGGFFGGKKK